MKFKDLKKSARKLLKGNLSTILLVGFLMSFILGEYSINRDSFKNLQTIQDYNLTIEDYKEKTGQTYEEIKESLTEDEYQKELIKELLTYVSSKFVFGNNIITAIDSYNESNQVYKGIIYTTYSAITNSRTQIQNVLNSMIKSLDDIYQTRAVFIIFSSIGLAIKIFLIDPIKVGEARLYLESINYKKTRFKTISYAFKKKRYVNSLVAGVQTKLLLTLWNLTIVGGLIKNYSYKMVDFIIAENPSIKAKDAILMSRKMMDGYKWKAFLLDLTFLPWNILVVLTFGIAGIYVGPYYRCIYTKIYESLRTKYIEEKNYNYEALNDTALYSNPDNKPTYDLATNEEQVKKLIEEHLKINREYDLWDFILFFFIFAGLGWLLEVGLFVFQYGVFVNRGTLYGPWLPIYGFGCSVILLITSKLSTNQIEKVETKPIIVFFAVTLLCTVAEYLTSYLIEKFTGNMYWNYNGIFMNINGRVCLENSLFFGIGGTFCIYVAGPFLKRHIHKLRTATKSIACYVLVSLILIDALYSVKFPHEGEYITTDPSVKTFAESENELEESYE